MAVLVSLGIYGTVDPSVAVLFAVCSLCVCASWLRSICGKKKKTLASNSNQQKKKTRWIYPPPS